MDIRKCAGALLVALTIAIGGCRNEDGDSPPNGDTEKDRTPNFITLVIDDMGFSDLGSYGGEIPTPNIDELAEDGVMLNNFYACATSTPTRGMLFTGKDHHTAGVGFMTSTTEKMEEVLQQEVLNQPNYESRLALDALPFPELLQQAGYHTMHTGKWDLGKETPEYYPSNRGFDVTRGTLLPGGGLHYSRPDGTLQAAQEGTFVNNGEVIEKFPKQFYSTEYYTDMAIEMLDERDTDKPFYLSLCYTAPHTPLHAPAEVTAKYLDVYAKGWDVIREERFERQKELGLWPEDAELPPLPDDVRSWDELSEEEQMISAKKMAIYAAMVDVLDENIGRLVSHLKDIGEYENTVIILFSDNGAGELYYGLGPDDEDNSYENLGNWNSRVTHGPEWSYAKNTPLHGNKGSLYDGGWHTPAIFHYPKAAVSGEISDRIVSVMDIAPTILEMAEIEYPDTYDGSPITPMAGISMADMFEGDLEYDPERSLTLELHIAHAVRLGDWKLVQPLPVTQLSDGDCDLPLHLYNLATDPFELEDIADEEPDIVEELKLLYDQYAEDNGVIQLPPCP
ncbi:arylsulfatase [Desulfonema magnum]|uniref:Sulfatase N-terminal domain-containing protein n=1 Tax=Desulfonema magnum TaxID=45655 RepID=A0A975BLJ5_9BACT|nr:arylsulfatase [Desulfonema magnum]QTA87817.1 Sulfatase N-terminal domain-containing protein [Desulfonema magnum]